MSFPVPVVKSGFVDLPPPDGKSGRGVVFYFDISCPFAYLGSRKIERVVSAAPKSVLKWRPVFLPELYTQTNAPQGPNSATTVMCPTKVRNVRNDLYREAARSGIPLRMNSKHPQRTHVPQRWLVAIDDAHRATLANALYKAYWVDDQDLSDVNVLQGLADSLPTAEARAAAKQSFLRGEDEQVKETLKKNTHEAVERGAYGVPSFWVHDAANEANGVLWFGQDRLAFVARALGAPVERWETQGMPVVLRAMFNTPSKPKLRVFHDFASPWSYLAVTQARSIARENYADLELVPIVLGVLFKSIGTPIVPGAYYSPAKRQYSVRDLQDWAHHWNVKISWPSAFPLRTITPLRVSLVYPELAKGLYEAAWVNDKDIGNPQVLTEVLNALGKNATKVIQDAEKETVKEALKHNTQKAIDLGLCGVPSFQVVYRDGSTSSVVWGQDRWVTVVDMLRGWKEPNSVLQTKNAKL